MEKTQAVRQALTDLLGELDWIDPKDDEEVANWTEAVVNAALHGFQRDQVQQFLDQPTFEERVAFLKSELLGIYD